LETAENLELAPRAFDATDKSSQYFPFAVQNHEVRVSSHREYTFILYVRDPRRITTGGGDSIA